MITEEKKTYRNKISAETANTIINYLYKSLPEGCNNYYLNVMNNSAELSRKLSGVAQMEYILDRKTNFGAHICVLPYEEKELREDGTRPFQHYELRQYYYITTLQFDKLNNDEPYIQLREDLLHYWAKYNPTDDYHVLAVDKNGCVFDIPMYDLSSDYLWIKENKKVPTKTPFFKKTVNAENKVLYCFKLKMKSTVVSNQPNKKRTSYDLINGWNNYMGHFNYARKGNRVVVVSYDKDGNKRKTNTFKSITDTIKLITPFIDTKGKDEKTTFNAIMRRFQRNLVFTLKGIKYDFIISTVVEYEGPEVFEKTTVKKGEKVEVKETKKVVELDTELLAEEALEEKLENEDMNTEDEIQKEINKLNSIPEEKPAVSEKSEIQKRLEAEVNANKYVYDFKTERQKLLGEQKRYVDEVNHIPTTEELSELVAMI